MSDPAVVEELWALGPKRVTTDEPMTRHTSWKVGGPADYLIVVDSEAQLLGAIRVAERHGLPWLMLGGGYNVLVSDRGIEGVVIVNRLRGIKIDESTADPTLECGAGVFFAKAAQHTARHGFGGMEWGIAIPGTVGGGVVNNAGAHWLDVSRALIDASVVDASGHVMTLRPDDLAYAYRHSALKYSHVARSELAVTVCRFRLTRSNPADAMARLAELRDHRLRTQPVAEASAGSTFKNPPGGHAGALLEAAGLKGYRIGDAQYSTLHANFLVNLGSARASDIVQLIAVARERVRATQGMSLEPEVQLVGRWSEAELCQVLGVPA